MNMQPAGWKNALYRVPQLTIDQLASGGHPAELKLTQVANRADHAWFAEHSWRAPANSTPFSDLPASDQFARHIQSAIKEHGGMLHAAASTTASSGIDDVIGRSNLVTHALDEAVATGVEGMAMGHAQLARDAASAVTRSLTGNADGPTIDHATHQSLLALRDNLAGAWAEAAAAASFRMGA